MSILGTSLENIQSARSNFLTQTVQKRGNGSMGWWGQCFQSHSLCPLHAGKRAPHAYSFLLPIVCKESVILLHKIILFSPPLTRLVLGVTCRDSLSSGTNHIQVPNASTGASPPPPRFQDPPQKLPSLLSSICQIAFIQASVPPRGHSDAFDALAIEGEGGRVGWGKAPGTRLVTDPLEGEGGVLVC